MQLDWSKNNPANTSQWHCSTHIFKPLWLAFLRRASLFQLGRGMLHKGVKQNRSSPAQTQDWSVVFLQPPLWPDINDKAESGAQVAGISLNFAHLTASNSPLAHRIYQTSFSERVEEEGKFGGRVENKGMDVQTRDMQCQVLSCPPSLSSSGRCSQNTAHNFEQHSPAFTKHREQGKVNRAQVSQYRAWTNQQFWQHPELAAGSAHPALPPTHRLNPDKSPHTDFSFCDCSYVILIPFLKLCKGHEGQFNQQRIFS